MWQISHQGPYTQNVNYETPQVISLPLSLHHICNIYTYLLFTYLVQWFKILIWDELEDNSPS